MTKWVRGPARAALRSSRAAVDRMRWGGEYARVGENFDPAVHIREAAEWLKRAQDAGTDRGVSYGASLGGSFLPSYPETTGYIIPTMLELADHYGDPDFERRAVAMGEWEIEIQMDCGAVMGGKFNRTPTPAVFNTGQVLLGWAALYRRTGDDRFRVAARRAVDWMLDCQDPDGNWRRGNSRFADPRSTVYNVKAGWGMVEAGVACGWDDAIGAGVRAAEYCVSRQMSNGWFADCCLGDPERPLLHTVAYSMQGLVGIGRLVNDGSFIDAARRTADSLRQLIDTDGFIPGRIDRAFKGTVDWSCLTGTAQTAIVWAQLDRLAGNDRYSAARRQATLYLMARHNITTQHPAFRGAVFGSWPFWGDYGHNKVLNWAVKFFVDAIYLDFTPRSRGWVY